MPESLKYYCIWITLTTKWGGGVRGWGGRGGGRGLGGKKKKKKHFYWSLSNPVEQDHLEEVHNVPCHNHISCATLEKGPYAIYEQRMSRWACASVQTDLDILCSSTYTAVSIHSVSGKRRPISACANAQADYGLRCPHKGHFRALRIILLSTSDTERIRHRWLSRMRVRPVIRWLRVRSPPGPGNICLRILITKYFLRSLSPFRWLSF